MVIMHGSKASLIWFCAHTKAPRLLSDVLLVSSTCRTRRRQRMRGWGACPTGALLAATTRRMKHSARDNAADHATSLGPPSALGVTQA